MAVLLVIALNTDLWNMTHLDFLGTRLSFHSEPALYLQCD